MRGFLRIFSVGSMVVALGAMGCGDSGSGGAGGATSSTTTTSSGATTSSASSTSDTTSSTAESGSATSSSTGSMAFALTSTDLAEGATFSTTNTCAGANESPAFAWTPGPANTQSYAMVLTDESNMLVHWVIWDIPATDMSLPAAIDKSYQPANVPGAKQPLAYDNQTRGYLGPCPPVTHTYQFDLYALDVPSLTALGMSTTRTQAVAEIMNHQIAKASLSGMGDPAP